MESIVSLTTTSVGGLRRRLAGQAIGAWTLAGALVLYLAFDGGGYDLAVHSQVGIVVWWFVIVGAASGLLPAARISRLGWTALALFAGFVGWTALATTWSISTERSLQDVSLVACYLGIFTLALIVHREREQAVRHTVGAVAAAVVLVAALAVASRLWPHLFPNAQQTAQFLGGVRSRLAWPLNYWNALAAMMALGLPLLLALATSARTLRAQAAAAAGIPLVALCGAMTVSRGGMIAAAAAVIVFIALAPERIPKLATVLASATGSAALIAGAAHRTALWHGLANAAARHESGGLVVAILLVCAGVAAVQTGIGLAARHGTLPRGLRVSVPRARVLLAATAGVCVVAGLAVGVPGKLAHLWHNFERLPPASLFTDNINRFGATSGNGRYQYWTVAVHSTRGHLVGGSGPGTFQLLWLPHASIASYVQNAHSLFVETLAEVGVVGLALLVAFFAVVLGAAIRLVFRARYESRARAAAVAAAVVAFLITAGFDWIWQVPVLPACLLLLAAAVLASPQRPASVTSEGGRKAAVARTAARVGAIAIAIGCLAAIAFPLATGNAVAESQAAASEGNLPQALADARQAARVEPESASPQLQIALVLELQRDYPAAIAAAQRAVGDEPQNWSYWLTLSRLNAEAGHVKATIVAYRRAESLNPQSSIFHL